MFNFSYLSNVWEDANTSRSDELMPICRFKKSDGKLCRTFVNSDGDGCCEHGGPRRTDDANTSEVQEHLGDSTMVPDERSIISFSAANCKWTMRVPQDCFSRMPAMSDDESDSDCESNTNADTDTDTDPETDDVDNGPAFDGVVSLSFGGMTGAGSASASSVAAYTADAADGRETEEYDPEDPRNYEVLVFFAEGFGCSVLHGWTVVRDSRERTVDTMGRIGVFKVLARALFGDNRLRSIEKATVRRLSDMVDIITSLSCEQLDTEQLNVLLVEFGCGYGTGFVSATTAAAALTNDLMWPGVTYTLVRLGPDQLSKAMKPFENRSCVRFLPIMRNAESFAQLQAHVGGVTDWEMACEPVFTESGALGMDQARIANNARNLIQAHRRMFDYETLNAKAECKRNLSTLLEGYADASDTYSGDEAADPHGESARSSGDEAADPHGEPARSSGDESDDDDEPADDGPHGESDDDDNDDEPADDGPHGESDEPSHKASVACTPESVLRQPGPPRHGCRFRLGFWSCGSRHHVQEH